GPRHGVVEHGYELPDSVIALGANIHLCPRARRNCIDAGAPLNDSHVHGNPGRRPPIQRALIDEKSNRAAERVHRIADTEIAPAMPAGAVESDLETPASQRVHCNMVRRRSVEHKEPADRSYQFGLTADVPDSTQIALAFF